MTPPFTIAATTATACVRLEHSGTRHERDVEGSLAGRISVAKTSPLSTFDADTSGA